MLSIVVVFHNMRREASRTLRSLSADYQRDLASEAYEVIAVDNGSTEPLDASSVRSFGPGFRYHFRDTESVSPVGAVNLGVSMAHGSDVAVIVDGARMASPGLVGETQRALRCASRPFVCALSWHLGPDVQNRSMLAGYDQHEEDQLLSGIKWPADGYRLFEISTLAQSSEPGMFSGVPVECSWWAMRRQDFLELGGFDSDFVSPGGGLVNHDFRNRVLQTPGLMPVVLLGEGVFHQFHGGVATNVALDMHPIADYRVEYERLRGVAYSPVDGQRTRYFGSLRRSARRFVAPVNDNWDQ